MYKPLILLLLISNFAFGNDMRNMFSEIPLDSKSNILSEKDSYLRLSKSALEKDFLLHITWIDGPPIAFGNAMGGRLVNFRFQNDKLYLFESPKGQVLTNAIPHPKVLLEFTVIDQDDDAYIFDFKEGLNKLFIINTYVASEYNPNRDKDVPVKIETSYIEKMTVARNYLELHEIAQVTSKDFTGSVQLKITFTPYQKNQNFRSKETTYQKKIGYFENRPILEANTGRSILNINKFSTNKKVVFHLSPQIPADYKQAVIDGVLYWNSAFGKEVIQVKELPSGKSVHDFGHNVIQWITYDRAGFAYADMKTDPLSGEILQAQVYMTSTFAVGGLLRGRSYLLEDKAPVALEKQLSLKGLSQKPICRYQKNSNSLALVGSILNEVKFDKKAILRFSQDYIRSVIAHEVGHTLGLRHNFAGNLSATLDKKDYKESVRTYLKSGIVSKDSQTSSSVMDYNPTLESVFQGAHIRLKHSAFSYDKKAIQWGYSLQKELPKEIPVFCTDGHKGSTPDCQVWDRLSNPVQGALFDFEQVVQKLPWKLALKFLNAKAPYDLRDKQELTEVVLSPKGDLKSVLPYLGLFLKMFSDKTSLLKINQDFPFISDLNKTEVQEQTQKFLKLTLEDMGGEEKFFQSLIPVKKDDGIEIPLMKNMFAQYKSIITNPAFLTGYRVNGESIPFTANDLITMNELGKKYFEKIEKFFINELLSILNNTLTFHGLDPHVMEGSIHKLAKFVLFTESSEIIYGKVNGKEVSLKKPFFPHQTRLLATKLYRGVKYTPWVDFQYNNQIESFSLVNKKLSKIGTAKQRATWKLPRPMRRFVINEEQVLRHLQ